MLAEHSWACRVPTAAARCQELQNAALSSYLCWQQKCSGGTLQEAACADSQSTRLPPACLQLPAPTFFSPLRPTFSQVSLLLLKEAPLLAQILHEVLSHSHITLQHCALWQVLQEQKKDRAVVRGRTQLHNTRNGRPFTHTLNYKTPML